MLGPGVAEDQDSWGLSSEAPRTQPRITSGLCSFLLDQQETVLGDAITGLGGERPCGTGLFSIKDRLDRQWELWTII